MVYAYLNHGRWIAGCPVCNGALAVEPGRVAWDLYEDNGVPTISMTDGSVFVCFDCRTDHGELQWPTPAQFDAITSSVSVRPIPNRNWMPGETVATLRAENIEHGLAA